MKTLLAIAALAAFASAASAETHADFKAARGLAMERASAAALVMSLSR